jgi:hypothetical protein
METAPSRSKRAGTVKISPLERTDQAIFLALMELSAALTHFYEMYAHKFDLNVLDKRRVLPNANQREFAKQN